MIGRGVLGAERQWQHALIDWEGSVGGWGGDLHDDSREEELVDRMLGLRPKR